MTLRICAVAFQSGRLSIGGEGPIWLSSNLKNIGRINCLYSFSF